MSYKIKFINPDITLINTQFLSDVNIGDTNLEVLDSSLFSVDDYIIIEDVGTEILEVRQISNIPDLTHIVISTAILHNHLSGVKVHKISYNQMRLFKLTNPGAVGTLVSTENIDYRTYNNKTTLTSSEFDANVYWVVQYYNSTTDVGVDNPAFKEDEFESIMTISELRERYDFTNDISDVILYDALGFADEQIKRQLYVKKKFSTPSVDKKFMILDDEILQIAKITPGIIFNSDDVIVYEIDQNDKKTFLNNKISRIDGLDKIIYFKENVPITSGAELSVEIFASYWLPDEWEHTLKYLTGLYASKFVLSRVPIKELQDGVGSWTLNSVSINIDVDSIERILESIDKKIEEVLQRNTRLYIRTTTMTNGNRFNRFSSSFGVRYLR